MGPARHPTPTGKRFGHLTVIGTAADRGGRTAYRCRCDCGTVKDIAAHQLRQGTRSCGCLRGRPRGRSPWLDRPEYRAWCKLKQHARAHGIAVTTSWAARHGFKDFTADMGEQPPGTQLWRVSRDAGYSRANCRWMTDEEIHALAKATKLAKQAGRPSPGLTYTYRWQIVSREYREAHPIRECDDCAGLPKGERPPSTEVHHRDGLGPSGPRGFDWDNLQAMSKPCHSRQTVREHGFGA